MTPMRRRATLLATAVLFLPGCTDGDPRRFFSDLALLRDLRAQIQALDATRQQLEAKVEECTSQLSYLESQVEDVDSRLSAIELERENYGVATFDPAATEGFQRLDSSIASFAVSIRDVKPLADGVSVILDIGNLTSATVNGVSVKVKWGPRSPTFQKGQPPGTFSKQLNQWKAALRETTVEITKDLKPATWNRVTLKLPKTPPAEFGHLELSLDASKISLFTSR